MFPDEKTRRRIVSLYESGRARAEVAFHTGVSVDVVGAVLTAYHESRSQPAEGDPTPDEIEQLKADKIGRAHV